MRVRLLHLNCLVWSLLLLLVLVFRDQLGWAWQALPAQLARGSQPTQAQWALYVEAYDAWERDADADRALALLERSLGIETNADPLLLAAEIHAAEGRHERALERFRQLIEFDPAALDAYLGAAEVYRLTGRPAERLAVLRQGLDWFERHLDALTPRHDDTVWEEYNEKAREVHGAYERARRVLQANVDLLEAGQEPY